MKTQKQVEERLAQSFLSYKDNVKHLGITRSPALKKVLLQQLIDLQTEINLLKWFLANEK
jgi:hypothetical protein